MPNLATHFVHLSLTAIAEPPFDGRPCAYTPFVILNSFQDPVLRLPNG